MLVNKLICIKAITCQALSLLVNELLLNMVRDLELLVTAVFKLRVITFLSLQNEFKDKQRMTYMSYNFLNPSVARPVDIH